MNSVCPDCGSFAEPENRMIKRRRVWGCSNGYCGAEFYHHLGKIFIRYQPWMNAVEIGATEYKTEEFEER